MVISIITPTFNSQNTIDQNVKSVINQSYKNFEHIIIDNISNDNTIEIIKKLYSEANLGPNLRITCEKDSGIAEAFNKGIRTANGEIIGILNSDDHYYDEHILNKIVEVFKNENYLFAHGNIYFKDAIYGSNIRRPLLCPVTKAMPYNHPTMFFRKEVYQEYGDYNTNYLLVMDYEFICRLTKSVNDFENKGRYINDDPLVTMNAGGASWQNELDSVKEAKKVLKLYDFWNFDARKNYMLRVLRTKIKIFFNCIHANAIIKLWRKLKWRS